MARWGHFVLTKRTPGMMAKRRLFQRRDDLMREAIALEGLQANSPVIDARIKELRAEIDKLQKRVENNYKKGAAFLPR